MRRVFIAKKIIMIPVYISGGQKSDNPVQSRITQKLNFAFKLNQIHVMSN